MSGSGCKRIAILCVVMVSLFQNGMAQETPSHEQTERAEATKQFAYFDALAKHFSAKLASGVPLERTGDSLLNWTIDRSWHGSYFVWTARGRPVMVGCFLADSEKPDRRRAFIELHTMVDEPFTPLSFPVGQTFEWNPVAVRNSTIPLNDVAAPAKKEQTRRSQMREIAQQFEVTMFRETAANDAQEELRMLAHPLYRYPTSINGSLEGAIFAFVTARGTLCSASGGVNFRWISPAARRQHNSALAMIVATSSGMASVRFARRAAGSEVTEIPFDVKVVPRDLRQSRSS